MFDVIGFGALNLDFIYDSENRLRTINGGGQAANTVAALSRMGFKCGYIGRVGDDPEGTILIDSFAQEGVDVNQIKQEEGRSGFAKVFLDHKGERRIFISPGANNLIMPQDIEFNYLETRFLHLTSFLGVAPFRAQKGLVDKLGGKVRFSLDPDIIYAEKGIDELLPLLKNLFVIFPNQEELEVMTGKNYQAGAKELIGIGVEVVACTQGERGCHIFSKTEEFAIPAEPVNNVIDTTGAGDVFAAGFLAGLLLDKELLSCAKIAVKAASQSITGYGRENYPDGKFLEEVLKNV